MTTSIIVSYSDDSSKNDPILLVGKKLKNNQVEVINAIHGNEAKELYTRLTTVKVALSVLNQTGEKCIKKNE